MGYDENRFAYIKADSKLEKEVFSAIESAIDNKLEEPERKQIYPLVWSIVLRIFILIVVTYFIWV